MAKQQPRKNKMGALDGRSMDHQSLERLRLRAVERIEAGERTGDVARALGFDRTVVSRWVSRARRDGIEALKSKPITGRPSKLDDKQLEVVRLALLSIHPPLWGFSSELWTRAMVAEVIERMFGITISKESVGRIMRERMGLTPQRPVHHACEVDDGSVKRWVEEKYPTIAKSAADKRAAIYFTDEAQVRSDQPSGTTWATSGETPVVEATGQPLAVNLISAISPEGELRWMQVEGRMSGDKFVEFLRALIKRRRKPVYVIVDDHPAHKAKVVKEFVKENKEQLELHFLPSRSPQLNPDEPIWNCLKNHAIDKRGFHTVSELKRV